MDLRRLASIIWIILLLAVSTVGQQSATAARCISPTFQSEIDSYLSGTVPTITVADAYPDRSRYTFLDAREIEEYGVSHIQDAIHIGYEDFDLKSLTAIDKDTPIIIYCSIGYRSEKIGKLLIDAGYSSVLNLYGSIFEWVNQHHPVYNTSGVEAASIHSYNRAWSKWISNKDVDIIW